MNTARRDELLKASGYVYRNGYKTREQFIAAFDFDPLKYPDYFREMGTGLIVANSNFFDFCENYFSTVKNNFAMLTDRIPYTPDYE